MSYTADGYWLKTSRKDKARNCVANTFGIKKPKVSILLPGIDIACIKKLFTLGHISKDMKFYIVERNTTIMTAIKAKIDNLSKQLYSQCIFHTGELHDLKLKHKVNFGYIDLLGNFTPQLLHWFRKFFLPQTHPSATIFMTLQKSFRNNDFMRGWKFHVWNNPSLKSAFKKQKQKQKFKHKWLASKFYNKAFPYTLWLLDGIFGETKKQFEYKKIVPYKDNKDGTHPVTMMFIKIKLINKPQKLINPNLSTINFDKLQKDYKIFKKTKELPSTLSIREIKLKLRAQKAARTKKLNTGQSVKDYNREIKSLEKQLILLLK